MCLSQIVSISILSTTSAVWIVRVTVTGKSLTALQGSCANIYCSVINPWIWRAYIGFSDVEFLVHHELYLPIESSDNMTLTNLPSYHLTHIGHIRWGATCPTISAILRSTYQYIINVKSSEYPNFTLTLRARNRIREIKTNQDSKWWHRHAEDDFHILSVRSALFWSLIAAFLVRSEWNLASKGSQCLEETVPESASQIV